MAATDATGLAIDYTGGGGTGAMTLVTYSAFGEVLDASGQPGGSAPAGLPRYQYAGGFGYESDLLSLAGANPDLPPITLQHLGWRWYDPAVGRFVQRDPLGVRHGRPNTFAYTDLAPTFGVDPSGLTTEAPPPSHPWVRNLPRGPGGWIKMPPGVRPKWVPGRGFVPVPRIPPPGPGSFRFAMAPTCLLIGAAAAAGAGIGIGINIGVKAATGKSVSDRWGEWIWEEFWPKPPGLPPGFKPY